MKTNTEKIKIPEISLECTY